MLRQRIGRVPRDAQKRLSELSLPQLESLTRALLDFSSADDLDIWLDKKSA
jgi:hypothetical protein